MLLESEETRSIEGRSCDDADADAGSFAFPNEEALAIFTRPLKELEVRDKQVRR